MTRLPALPLVDLTALAPTGRIAVIAPHPDDESLGCGGLIALALRQARPVTVVVVTDGAASHPGSNAYPPAAVARLREGELRGAVAVLGLALGDLVQLRLDDGELDRLAAGQLADQLAAVLGEHRPQNIFSPGPADSHPDHRAVFNASLDVAERLGCTLWSYPIRAHVAELSANGAGALALDISSVLELKRQAIACHASQFGRVILDDPGGFHLTSADQALHGEPCELFEPARRARLNSLEGSALIENRQP